MGILKSLFTLGKSFISQAEESIEETQGVRMLEQHIRDAKAELDKAGKSRVDLLARVKLSHDKLKDLRERKASLEARALEALSKNVNPSLINEVAEEIARLENLITAEEQVLSNLEVSRDGVEKAVTATAQRIAQFEQQMEVVKATEAMQRAQQAVTTSTVGGALRISLPLKSKCCRIWKSLVMAWKKQLQRQRSVSLSLSSKWKSLKPLKPCSVHNRL